MRYNTNNPVGPDGSSDPRDMHDNAKFIDLIVNSKSSKEPDRFGVLNQTFEGMRVEVTETISAALQSTGWFNVGSFSNGFDYTARNQTGEHAGSMWSYNGPFNSGRFTVIPGTVPSEPLYTNRGDASLRTDLIKHEGARLINFGSFKDSDNIDGIDLVNIISDLGAREIVLQLKQYTDQGKSIASFNGFNSNAPVIDSLQGVSSSTNGELTQITAAPGQRNRIINAIGSGTAKNVVTYKCERPHGLSTGERVILKGFNFPSFNTGGTNNSGLPVGQQMFKATPITVVDDYNFAYSLGGNQTGAGIADSSTNAWWEHPPKFWDVRGASFNWVLPNKSAISLAVNNATYNRLNIGVDNKNPQSKVSAVEFYLNDVSFEMWNVRGFFHVYADGVRVTNKRLNLDQPSFPGFMTKFTFDDARIRLIRIEALSVPATLWGIVTAKQDGIISGVAAAVRKPIGLMCGDSFGEGTGTAGGWTNSFPYLLSRKLGIEMIHGSLGSTGMTTNGTQGAGANYAQRMKRLKELGVNPDFIFIMDSVNDRGNPTTSLCSQFLLYMRSLWPASKLILLGRMSPSENVPTSSMAASAAWIATCKKYGVPYLDGGIGATGKPLWLTASNKPTFYNGTSATASASVNSGSVSSISVVNAGLGYDFTAYRLGAYPLVTISGGGGTGAVASAVVDFSVTALEILHSGTGYTSATLTITHGAEVDCLLSGSGVYGCRIVNPGYVFTKAPEVIFSGGGGDGASATAVVENGRLVAINMTSAGTGYTSAPTVSLKICDIAATATAVIVEGSIVGITITNPGAGYTDIPVCIISGDGFGANVVPFLSGRVTSVQVSSSGSGYASAPTVNIAHPTNNDVTHPKSEGHRMIAERFFAEIELY